VDVADEQTVRILGREFTRTHGPLSQILAERSRETHLAWGGLSQPPTPSDTESGQAQPRFCRQARAAVFMAMRRHGHLDAWRETCW
jgi:hypothetical protein